MTLIGLAYLTFISLGLRNGLVSVAWPTMSSDFAMPLEAFGVLLSTFTAGYLVATATSGTLLARWGLGLLMVGSISLITLGLVGSALMPLWAGVVALSAVGGFGTGVTDIGLNSYAATNFNRRLITWMHASFGVGAAVGPLITSTIIDSGASWRWGYAVIGGLQLLIVLSFVLTHRDWTDSAALSAGQGGASSAGLRPVLRLPAMWISIAMFFIYPGIEMGMGQWAFSILTIGRGMEPTTAGLWVSLYWSSLTVGRIVSGMVGSRLRPAVLVRGALVGAAVLLVLFALNLHPLLNAVSLVGLGLALAPIFPSLVATTPDRVGTTYVTQAISMQVAAASLGTAAIPSLMGVLSRSFTLEVIAVLALGTTFLMYGVHEVMARRMA